MTASKAPSFEFLLERDDLVWMGQNTTHLPPAPEVLAALELSTRRHEFQVYAPALGFSRLRELIVEDLGLEGARAWVTDGAVAGLHHIVTSLAPTLSKVVTTDPGWPWPGRFATVQGVPVSVLPVYSPEAGFKVLAEQLAAEVTERALIYLIDPLNPLGSRYTREELEAITTLARERGAYLVHDCTYRHFAKGHTLAAELYPEGTFTTYSFSKWLGLAGLRLGAVVAQPQLLDRLTEVPSNPLGAGITAQRAAIAGLEVRAAWLENLTRVNDLNQQIVKDVVDTSGLGRVLVWPSHGNFLAVDVSGSGWSADGLCEAMLEQDIFIRPGTYQSPGFGERFVKISTSVPTAWVRRFAAAWEDLAKNGQAR
ncbi:pyridoxal phosphate-dependent aminotransferase [Kineosporia sp. NBRC 101731]|uniref:pyridoxal phosphate-dependent aminotransferase n=1 Tax=Kineosporia sp. NBRC 101731 TaxID=3032199 RepID=UPI0024A54381|nr:pyridoxal phosphate-dependent aminotransferase [Kineosporia sp. NBRC 101731]GLY30965.1 aminotransferase [Kineosporia sp. NBRC 101731]